MPKLKGLGSYETLKFDTPDGDLHKGQYAFYQGEYYIRVSPENKDQPRTIDQEKEIPEDLILGLEPVGVIPNEKMYYDEFELPDGRKYRVPSSKKDYEDLAKPNAKVKEKVVSDAEILDIKKEDSKWL